MVIDKTMCSTTIIDVAVTVHWKVKNKDEILKYQVFRIEMHKIQMEYKSESYNDHSVITGRNTNERRDTS